MDSQDWTTVQMKRKVTKTAPPPFTAAKQEAIRLARLDNADDVKPKRRRLTAESRHALAAARTAIKKTQRDVDKELAFPPNTVRDYEAGTLTPSGPQISALQRYFAASHLVLRVETVV